MSAGPVLRLEELSVAYRTLGGLVHAVRGVSLDVERGAAVGLVGESGSGKTTVGLSVLRLIGADAAAASGRIWFQGRDLMAAAEDELREIRGNRISTVFQDPLTSLTPSLTVGEQIAETTRVHGKATGRAAWRRAIELLGLVGLPDPARRARQYPHQLSGGMRQRVAIAIAIACDPELIILDEPTTALDVTIQAQILDLLNRLRDEYRMSILLITHDLGVVAQVCDRVCVLYAGQLVETGATPELFGAPLHPYTKGLLACLPRIAPGADRQRLPHVPGRVPDLAAVPAGCVFAPRCCFAEDRCATERQVLRPAGPGRRAACWKWEPLAGEPWPAGGAGGPGARRGRAGHRLATLGLSKAYRLSGLWDSLRVRRGRHGLPVVRWEPVTLRAVDQVSLSLGAAETLALVGESGCGKSTLGLAVVGLVRPTGGRVELDGQDRSAALARRAGGGSRREVQIIFQNPDSSLNPRKTVGEIVGRPLRLYRLRPRQAVADRVRELLTAVQLAPAYADRYPHQLSGGEKQRVGIARALAAEPDFIVCDEPISALDLSVRASILNLLDDLKRQLGLSLLFIAHDLAVVRHIADRVAVMYRGRICEVGDVAQVFEPPYHPYTWALLSAIPSGIPSARGPDRVRLRGSATDAQRAGAGCVFSDRCPVKLGEVCDRDAPPEVEVASGHVIACHHEAAVLRDLALADTHAVQNPEGGSGATGRRPPEGARSSPPARRV
jgi:peptide/nickel transport system ATP-binding protein